MLETAKNPDEKVRQLQRRLWVCAKQSRTRRFHALYDRIYRSDVLWEAWKRVRSNKGAAGVDEVTLRSIEEQGVQQFLEGLQADLKAGRYRPSAVKRRWIPKADGQQRPLGIATVRDRVIQMAAKLVIEPIFEADFQPSSYGFRPKRSATQALEALRRIGLVMDRLGLKLHPEKTRMVDLRRGQESFVFLGCTIRKKRSIQRNPRMHFMQRWPSPKAMKRIRERVHELTDARHSGKDVKQIIATLNPVLRGWGNYFRTGNAERKFNQLDSYVYRRLAALDGPARRAAQRADGKVDS